MANAVEVADADPLPLQILERLDMRRPNPKVRVLVSPTRDDVKIGAPRALVENGARLNIESDVYRFFFHRLRDAEFFQAEGHHRVAQNFVRRTSIRGPQPFVIEKVHFVRRHYRHLMEHVITSRGDSEFSVEHEFLSASSLGHEPAAPHLGCFHFLYSARMNPL